MYSERIHNAVMFATIAHKGQTRKGNDIPYIYHPMEVLQILTEMGCDEDVKIAGALHDTVEDTDTTIEDIKVEFGGNVASLVGGHTEDKSKTWKERKEDDLDSLRNGNIGLKAIIFADKLSNILSLYDDYKANGDKVYEKFNAGKDMQAWYYGELLKVFVENKKELSEAFVSEYESVYKNLFGKLSYLNMSDIRN